MNRYIYAPDVNQYDDIMQPINPLGAHPGGHYNIGREGWAPSEGSWYLAGIDETLSPMIRSDVATPTTDMMNAGSQFAIPALNGGLGAVQDALSVLAVVDLMTGR